MGRIGRIEDVRTPAAAEAFGEAPVKTEIVPLDVQRIRDGHDPETVVRELLGALRDANEAGQESAQALESVLGELSVGSDLEERLGGIGEAVLDVAEKVHSMLGHRAFQFRFCPERSCDEWRYLARSQGWSWG